MSALPCRREYAAAENYTCVSGWCMSCMHGSHAWKGDDCDSGAPAAGAPASGAINSSLTRALAAACCSCMHPACAFERRRVRVTRVLRERWVLHRRGALLCNSGVGGRKVAAGQSRPGHGSA